MNSDTRLVYSTETGRICPACRQPVSACKCKKGKKRNKPAPSHKNDGIVRIQREVKGRGGKCVSAVYGLNMDDHELKNTAKKLKTLCGTGGTVKNGTILIQGDHRQKLQAALQKEGFTVKLAGG